jgi:hypothetical protein
MEEEKQSVSIKERISALVIGILGGNSIGLIPFIYIKIMQVLGRKEIYEKDFVYQTARQSCMAQFVCHGVIMGMLMMGCFITDLINGNLTTTTRLSVCTYCVCRLSVIMLAFVGVVCSISGRVFRYPFMEEIFIKTNLIKHIDGEGVKECN